MATLADELRAASAARRELGEEYDQGVLRSLADRVDAEVERRVAERRKTGGVDWTVLLLALGSIGMALGVPSATQDHFGAAASYVLTLIAWAAITAINVAYAQGRRRGR